MCDGPQLDLEITGLSVDLDDASAILFVIGIDPLDPFILDPLHDLSLGVSSNPRPC